MLQIEFIKDKRKGIIRTILDNHRDIALYRNVFALLRSYILSDAIILLYKNEDIDSVLDAIYKQKLRIKRLEEDNEKLKLKIAEYESCNS